MQTRRTFLKSSLLGASALSLNYIPASAMGANDRLRAAVLGVGGRGNNHCEAFAALENVQLVAVADPDLRRAEGTKKRWEEKIGTEITAYQDPRKLLEDKSIDVVSVASCNHWHTLLSLWSAEAGKHVYCEKPCSHTLFESRQLVNAMKRYGILIQHGTQHRSNPKWQGAARAFQSGKYGKPIALFAYVNRTRNGIGFKPVQDPPKELDWNLWLGPVDYQPYTENNFVYNWHWFWNTGDGEIGNNGVHMFDLSRLAAGNPHVQPRTVQSFGTRLINAPDDGYKDQGETPSIQAAVYDLDGLPVYYSCCNLRDKNNPWKSMETAHFVTDEGVVTNSQFISNDGKSSPLDPEFNPEKSVNFLNGTVDHFQNFVDCVRANTPEKLVAPIVEGHYSTSLCHLGNISYRTGRQATLAECMDSISDHPLLVKEVEAALANVKSLIPALNLEKDVPFTLGQKLEFDSETEKFVSNPAADALLRRPGRGEFVVKEY